MTIAEIRAALEVVRALAQHSDERAHIAADNLHQRVLGAIADGTCEDPQLAARLALETEDTHFSRWYS